MRTILQMTKMTFLTLNVQQSTIPHEIILLFSIHNINIYIHKSGITHDILSSCCIATTWQWAEMTQFVHLWGYNL